MEDRVLKMGVAYIPNDCLEDDPSVYIVVDVIRATSTIVTLFEQECDRIFLTDSVDYVHAFHDTACERFLICAEDAVGRRLQGADFSPSLSEVHNNGSFVDKSVVIQTSNGTAALQKLARIGAEDIYIGSMLNLKAVTEAAIATALAKDRPITVVCAGRNAGKWITLDDVYCAAKILEHAMAFAEEAHILLTLFDSARIAHSQLRIYEDSVTALTQSASAENLRRIGMTGDIELCAKQDLSSLAPKIHEQSQYPFIEIRRK